MNVRIVEALRAFENADAARVWAMVNVRGRSAVNKQTAMVICIGRRAVEKTLSESAILKSSDVVAHLSAVSVLNTLLETAVLVKSHPDRDHDPNIRQIHRFYAAFLFKGKIFRVKITVKEFVQAVQGIGFYAYELAQIEMPERKQADAFSEEQTSAPHSGVVNLTELLGGASAD